MRVLITGGAGFIGSHLVDFYLKQNANVIAVDNLSTGKISNIEQHFADPKFIFYEADILNWPELQNVLETCDLVYHMAATVGMFNVLQHPITTLEVNIYACERLLSTVAKLSHKPRMIFASSSEVYGSKPQAMKEGDVLYLEATNKAHASYPVSKLCNEVTAMAYYKEKRLPVTVVRIFNTVGTRQTGRYGMVLPRFIQQALQNKVLTIFGEGQQTRAFCDVRDLCCILHQLTESDKSVGEIINVGCDKSIAILELAELVKQMTHSHSLFSFEDFEEVYGKDYINIQNRQPDLSKLQSFIHYSWRWQLEDTIRAIIAEQNA